MELKLQQGLEHQDRAIQAISDVFKNVQIQAPSQFYQNPHFDIHDLQIAENIKSIQKGLPTEYRSNITIPEGNHYLSLDIKMETGTGKTYVYTKTIYELNKRYGFNKFIIVVPSLPIKSNTKNFLKEPVNKKFFSDSCGYGTEIETLVLESQTKKSNPKNYFPSAVSDFVKGSCQNTRKIYVLLVNSQLLTNGKMLTDDYDYGVFGEYKPMKAISSTKPIVMIDEPHRFNKNQKSYNVIVNDIKPQAIIRYGATFPEITKGKRNNKITVKDYQNLLYNLDACASFNQGLIKGVAKENLVIDSNSKNEKVKILSIDNKEKKVNFQFITKDNKKTYQLKKDDSLSIISDAFEGITIKGVAKKEVEFSNGVIKPEGSELDVDIYMTSYQEAMLKLALHRHFEIEKENFCSRQFKIKTLALFFIDDITSYRASDDGKKPYLLEAFERLLKEEIENVMESLDSHEQEYKKYLQASLDNIEKCHGGYFSQDNSDSDADIAKEVDIILNGKKQLLSFTNEDGTPNTMRFLFSKWTLKEGWDNPNVFTIAKLRSSGSDISKLQEVGRGLRLPVDENGNRISNEEFYLNYIVDFTEADFAEKLVSEINGERSQTETITDQMLDKVSKSLGMSSDDLFDELYSKKYIDRHGNIKSENKEQLFEEYPQFINGIKVGDKIKDRNKEKPKKVKIRKDAYEKIRELWEKVNQRYVLYYEQELNNILEKDIVGILESSRIFTDSTISSDRARVNSDGQTMTVSNETGMQYNINSRKIPYNQFLMRISKITNIPIRTIHRALCEYARNNGTDFVNKINERSIINFDEAFKNWKSKVLQGRFNYKSSKSPVGETALTYSDGTVRKEISQGVIGTKMVEGTPSMKYLYDTFAYDSDLEKDNIRTEIDEVIVYGKIPRKSIAIPTIANGTYSPDFMYLVKNKDGQQQLNIIVETKDVTIDDDLRGVELAKIDCAKIFFDNLSNDGIKVHFKKQLNHKQMQEIIEDIIAEQS